MDFLAGAMLWGGLAAVIPVLLHLTGRTQPVVHKFPALRFLQRSQRSSSRVLRLKHILLLLLRVLAILLLVLALARPRWPFPALAAELSGQVRGEFVLVLDASLSMQHRERDGMRFDQARRQALRFLERLAPEARVALVLATEEAEHLQGRLTLNHERVRELLDAAKPTAQGLDLSRALGAARAILEREPAGSLPRAVVLFTDLQRNAFLALQARGTGVNPGAETSLPSLCVVDAGTEGAVNGAALSARLPGPTVAADAPLLLTARIRPVDPFRVCPVDLYIDGLKVAQRALDPRGAAEVDVEFSLPPSAAGPHSGRLRLAQNDGLPLDQERSFAYVAGKPPRILVLERPAAAPEAAGGPAARGSAFFLRAVLESPAALAVGGHTVTVEPAGPRSAASLAPYQAVLLADPGDLDDPTWVALAAFVEEGGGLFAWLGPHASPTNLRRWGYSEFSAHRGLLPGTPGGLIQAEAGKSWSLQVAQAGHPLLARFTPGVRSALSGVRVTAYVQVTHELKDPGCALVLKLSHGAPLLLEKSYGRGRVLLCTCAPDLDGNDLPRHGEVFLTLVLEACRLLTGRIEEQEVRLGRTWSLTIPEPPPDGAVQWLPPGVEEAVTLQLEGLAAAGTDKPKDDQDGRSGKKDTSTPRFGTLLVPRVETPGVHRFTWQPRPGQAARVLLVAANPEPSESDLARVKPEEALQALRPYQASLVRQVEELPALEAGRSGGRELPVPLLLLVLVCLLVESFLSNRLYRNQAQESGSYQA